VAEKITNEAGARGHDEPKNIMAARVWFERLWSRAAGACWAEGKRWRCAVGGKKFFCAGWGIGRSFIFLMDRIAQAFARARSENRAAFVAYLCAGDPDLETAVAACRAVIEAGTDVLELGVPFSDPLADGLTNQLAAQRALASGMTGQTVFELVKRIRAFSEVPIVFYTYYNLIFANGVDGYVKAAKEAGVDGILTLDLPPEEAGDVAAACRAHGVKTVFIVAPTTPEARMEVIGKAATGFIYYVSREGVTGVRNEVAKNVPEAVAKIKAHTTLPVVVGFGISKREHVHEVAGYADGVVVGSALVNCIRENLTQREKIAPAITERAKDLVAGLGR
jgi:tryptophan synthase alpha chain